MCSRSRKQVRFGLVADTVIPRLEMEHESVMPSLVVESTWYTTQEMERFRMESRLVASGIRNRFKADVSNPTSYSNILIMVHQLCLRKQGPSEEIIQQLANWLEVGATRRGLEKLSVDAIYRDRRSRIKNSIQAVLTTQDKFKNNGKIEDEEIAEQIRLVYQEITFPAKLFAVSLGVADAVAAKQVRDAKITLRVRTISSAA
jgi:hypothetical protein